MKRKSIPGRAAAWKVPRQEHTCHVLVLAKGGGTTVELTRKKEVPYFLDYKMHSPHKFGRKMGVRLIV